MSTKSRFSSAPGSDNTDRIRDNEYLTPAYATTVTINPSKNKTLANFAALTGAMTINAGVGTASTAPYVGDEMKMLFTAATTQVVTFGTGILPSAATLSVTGTKTANVKFVFNGASWCEETRTVTA